MDFPFYHKFLCNFHCVCCESFQTVLKGGSLVGGLSPLHTQEISMIKAGEVSQYGGPQELLSELYLRHTETAKGSFEKRFFMQNCYFNKT